MHINQNKPYTPITNTWIRPFSKESYPIKDTRIDLEINYNRGSTHLILKSRELKFFNAILNLDTN